MPDRQRKATTGTANIAYMITPALLLVIFYVGSWWIVVDHYMSPKDIAGRKDVLLTVVPLVGATALLLGLFFTWSTLRLNQQGQVTERFSGAVEQMGKDSLAEKLGGIYSLEWIARDSTRDRQTIVNVLTAYARANSQANADNHGDDVGSQNMVSLKHEIQAILDAVSRINLANAGRQQLEIDFSRCYLCGAYLRNAYLKAANFSDANLDQADLTEADLRDAILVNARLQSWLPSANLNGAILVGADIRNAILTNATLVGANLTQADFTGVDLTGADLSSADVTDAVMKDANLSSTRLSNVRGLSLQQRQAASLDESALEPTRSHDFSEFAR